MSRLMVKILQTDDYFSKQQLAGLRAAVTTLPFQEREHGKEIVNFNLIQPGVDEILSRVAGEPLAVDTAASGIFRIPNLNIHFEGFDSPNEWCFAVALEKSTFNIYYHLSGARNALEGYRFNYQNLFEWDYHTNILLEPNQGIFFRPWIFHSFSGGVFHMYRLKSTGTAVDKKIILVMGLPGSGKTTLAARLGEKLGASVINSGAVRKMYGDNDFTVGGRTRQAQKLRHLAHFSDKEWVIVDSVCPLVMTRDYISPDYTIWMDTGATSTLDIEFQPPEIYSLRIKDFNYSIDSIISAIQDGTGLP